MLTLQFTLLCVAYLLQQNTCEVIDTHVSERWIINQNQFKQILNANNGEGEAKNFTMNGGIMQIQIYPNGDTPKYEGFFVIGLYPYVMPAKWKEVIICHTIDSSQTNSKYTNTRTFGEKGWSWPMKALLLKDIQELNFTDFVISVDLDIQKIIGIDNDILYEYPLIYNNQHHFEWKLDNKTLQQIPNAYVGKVFQSVKFNDMWIIGVYPNGDIADRAGFVNVFLELLGLPPNAWIIIAQYTIKCIELQATCISTTKFNISQTSMDGWDWDRCRLPFDEFKDLSNITFVVDIQILDVFDRNGHEIYELDLVNYNNAQMATNVDGLSQIEQQFDEILHELEILKRNTYNHLTVKRMIYNVSQKYRTEFLKINVIERLKLKALVNDEVLKLEKNKLISTELKSQIEQISLQIDEQINNVKRTMEHMMDNAHKLDECIIWLQNYKLIQFLPALLQNGWSSVTMWQRITTQQLKKMDIKDGHLQRFNELQKALQHNNQLYEALWNLINIFKSLLMGESVDIQYKSSINFVLYLVLSAGFCYIIKAILNRVNGPHYYDDDEQNQQIPAAFTQSHVAESEHIGNNYYPSPFPEHLNIENTICSMENIKQNHASYSMLNDEKCILKECQSRYNFVVTMKQYNGERYADALNILHLVNDHLHLLQYHNHENKDFDHIVDELRHCDVKTCNILRRNNRNRNIIKENDGYNPIQQDIIKNNVTYYQILDTLHCYYFHCVDIGNRLSLKERLEIEQYLHIDNIDDIDGEKQLIDKGTMKMNEILSQKTNRYIKQNNKFNQLQNINNFTKSERNIYCFGRPFYYIDSGEPDDIENKSDIIKPDKYSSLKEELTMNEMENGGINIRQFENEQNKALILFRTEYKKKYYSQMNIDQLLSLMVYCNFTEFQYQFSKTYREFHPFKHDYYYHLGKNLKDAVHRFSNTEIKVSNVQRFYHGIGEQLSFPDIIGCSGMGVCIYCPLSTTSSIEVAANFTNNNDGLIVEFRNDLNAARYLSLGWLSDFGNENEYLFIQNENELKITNITNVRFGIEYRTIINALEVIDKIVSKEGIENEIDPPLQTLTKAIIENRLSRIDEKRYKAFKSLDEYATNMINNYFENKIDVKIDCSNITKDYSFVSELLCYGDNDWIQMDLLLDYLFSNANSFEIINVNVTNSVLKDIKNYFAKAVNINLDEMKIIGNNAKFYVQQFNELNFQNTADNTWTYNK